MNENQIASIDVSQLVVYLNKASEIASVSKMMGGVYLQDLIKGQDVAGQLVAKAVTADLRAKAALDRVESIAYLDNAAPYLAARGIKDSSEARKRYIDVDPDVLAAKDHKAMTEALVVLLKTKQSVLRQAHDDLKKMLYESQHMTGYEGM